MAGKRFVLVVGSPGAGKTSVVKAVEGDRRYRVFGFGTMMTDIGIKRGYIKDRDEVRYLPQSLNDELRQAAGRDLQKQKGKIIIDSHLTVEEHGRFLPGSPSYLINDMKGLAAIAYIDATAKEIMARRRRDKSRYRETEDVAIMDVQRTLNLSIAAYYATSLNIPLYIIHNKEGMLKEAQKAFKRHLEDAFSQG